MATTNSRRVEVISRVFEIPVTLHTSETGDPYVLRGSIVHDSGVPKFDMRLFYERHYKEQSYFTPTDKGIRFTLKDVQTIEEAIKWSGEECLSDRLFSILNNGFKWEEKLEDGRFLIIDRGDDAPVPYVNFRRHYLHRVTNELVPTSRGFKLVRADLRALKSAEQSIGRSIFSCAESALADHIQTIK